MSASPTLMKNPVHELLERLWPIFSRTHSLRPHQRTVSVVVDAPKSSALERIEEHGAEGSIVR